MAAIAGCSNGGSSGSGSAETETPTATGTAEFEFEGVNAPDTVELNEPISFAIRVRNVGSGRGTFTSGLSTKVGDGEWRSLEGEISMPLDAGEAGVWESPEVTPRYLATVSYRLDAVDEAWSISVGPRRLPFDERYATPSGLFVSVVGGRFESTYPTDGGTTAPDGSVWAVVRVDVRNRLQEAQPAPDASTFTVESGGEVRELAQSVTDNPYEGGELATRTVRRGDLVVAVPEGTTPGNLTVTWEQSTENGDVRAIWSGDA